MIKPRARAATRSVCFRRMEKKRTVFAHERCFCSLRRLGQRMSSAKNFGAIVESSGAAHLVVFRKQRI